MAEIMDLVLCFFPSLYPQNTIVYSTGWQTMLPVMAFQDAFDVQKDSIFIKKKNKTCQYEKKYSFIKG